MPARRIALGIVAGLVFLAAPTATKASQDRTATAAALGTPHVVASGLNVPWGIAFLPNGDALVSERATGRIKRISKKTGRVRTVLSLGEGRTDGAGAVRSVEGYFVDITDAVRLMSEPCLWRWEIREPAQGEVVANSWTSEWMAYESPDEAFRAGQARLSNIARRR